MMPAHPVLQMPAIPQFHFIVKVHWLSHLVFLALHVGLMWSPKSKISLSHQHLKI